MTLESLEEEDAEERMDEGIVESESADIGDWSAGACHKLFAGVKAKARMPWWGEGQG
jgi:hypothetical protein